MSHLPSDMQTGKHPKVLVCQTITHFGPGSRQQMSLSSGMLCKDVTWRLLVLKEAQQARPVCCAGSRAYARVLSHRRGPGGAGKRRPAAFEGEEAAGMPPSRSASSSSSLQWAPGQHADVPADISL